MKNRRCIITLKKLLGIMLCSLSLGMCLALLISWWGYIVSFLFFSLGICLICSKK